jgi:hypothetical protein
MPQQTANLGGLDGILPGKDDGGRRVRQHHDCCWFRNGAEEI